ncbi:peptidase domain-containing ABC transporter [Elizabethkingia anophelis]|uniref:peptidase domain-containing ABC transporter n=1 Tax=Elizabethkingia anophelis TaxID=1117645 RepID=UPI00136D436C|nr:peptidase domain-containing ABC transporter [Elizabethkingia anophelis]MCT4124290.1 peptidase domain-containing ABC transporter [Elizabethkingia anophelis]MCT4326833.1 peptidase domain-containing ABC transporter [Elizabethkingia anophelis]MYY43880.1 peptidase domain-containing ABC transporter [Elizabethkingia anophelis]
MKFVAQHDQMDCGPACLAMVSAYYEKEFSLQYLRESCFITREGVSLLNVKQAAEKLGFVTSAAQLEINDIESEMLPCILHWNQNHFVILRKIKKNPFSGKKRYKIADPGHGLLSISQEKFNRSWITEAGTGIALFLEPTELFFNQKEVKEGKLYLKSFLKYLRPFKKQLLWLFLLLLLGTITTLVLPILTQRLIDDGVNKKDLNIIVYILLAQLAFYLGNIVFEIFRNAITLNVGTKINIHILSDFFRKMLKLPISFFDTKMMGDFNQRIQDHDRIEQFLTSQSLLTFFSIITFSVFFGILWYYDYRILVVYICLTVLSVLWSLFWLQKRKVLDYFRFQHRSENQEAIYEIINGVTEMKLNQFEESKRKDWEKIQLKLYKINIRILRLNQIELSGFEFINQIKNILVTFLAANFVINDKMTLGALLSVSYIVGQMNSPINQLVVFFRSLQEAKLSLARLNEVQNHSEEEWEGLIPLNVESNHLSNGTFKGILLNDVSFQYEGPKSPFVLKDIELTIPEGKVTAVVGASGSGKTTLMKLLLKFYDSTHGVITYDDVNILSLSPKSIRENCGVVMQDGYIFSDTIERNIATGDETIDIEKLFHAVRVANIDSFIDNLPLGFKTKIGAAGNGISGGQKQRILIARAVYKNPHYIFFDEATSALDAENEKIIHDNLQSFFKGKTVVIIAHRLSTVKNADQIIVLKNGAVVEQGNHNDLVHCKGEYFNLVKNQLELGI